MKKALLLLAVGLLLFGCIGGEEATPTVTPTIEAQPEVISILDGSFSPNEINVGVNEEVIWVNDGTETRVLYFIDGESPLISPGQEFARSFEVAGEYNVLGEKNSELFTMTIKVS